MNCAAIANELFEAELFGHARGAFTGATGERAGLFEEADRGTLFLDEVSELSARAQAKLLRAIQEGEIRRVGENFARKIDARLIAATNRSLSAEVAAGRFRRDLFYRVNVVRIVVPPLHERVEDIPALANHFWTHAVTVTGSRASLDPATFAALARYDWPGNVRELQNVMTAFAVNAARAGGSLVAARRHCWGVRCWGRQAGGRATKLRAAVRPGRLGPGRRSPRPGCDRSRPQSAGTCEVAQEAGALRRSGLIEECICTPPARPAGVLHDWSGAKGAVAQRVSPAVRSLFALTPLGPPRNMPVIR